MPNMRRQKMVRRPGCASAVALAAPDGGRAGRRLPAQGNARHLRASWRSIRRSGRGSAPGTLARTLPLGGSRGGADVRRRAVARTDQRLGYCDHFARECVRATFFLIGQAGVGMAGHRRERMAAAGHTRLDITHGRISALQRMPHADARRRKSTTGSRRSRRRQHRDRRPRRRRRRSSAFPASNRRQPLLDLLQSRGISGVRRPICWANDWVSDDTRAGTEAPGQRLEVVNATGIILLHDHSSRRPPPCCRRSCAT